LRSFYQANRIGNEKTMVAKLHIITLLGGMQMNAVGIDVSKGKSMIAVMRPFGEVLAKPFEVHHTASELTKLADYLKSLDGEVRVVLEYTGRYYQPISRFLNEAGIFVSAVHAKLIHDYGNTIRKVCKYRKLRPC
jgi:transposase